MSKEAPTLIEAIAVVRDWLAENNVVDYDIHEAIEQVVSALEYRLEQENKNG